MPLSKLLFSFEGRIPRSTFWYYVIALLVLEAAAIWLDFAIGGYNPKNGYGCATVAVSFVGVLTGLAVLTKRCQDRDRPGWFLLVGLIPVVGQLWLILELGLRRGTVGPNGFGADPLGEKQLSVE